MTIESSPSGENEDEEDVRLSQLNLIDLAGSESSKTETTGLRRKEGSYINKSLLTLGTVISKLTDVKATHIPYRDSKLTRLLQSSLSGHGRVSLICTVTPASSNSEETHNTLKFAHRSKYVEIKASQNKIMDEKSLIKKYQREISCLKQELQQLKRGMMENPYMITSNQEDLVSLKLQLEAGQVKLQSRLEEEEEAKAALMGRIQRLTKLILVSTKNSLTSNISDKSGHRRRHSFGEDELAYLPDRKREYLVDDEDSRLDSESTTDVRFDSCSLDEPLRFDKRNRRTGMLGWLKLKKSDQLSGLSSSAEFENSVDGSPCSSQSSQQKQHVLDLKDGRRKSVSRKGDDPSARVDSFSERTQAGDLFSVAVKGRRLPPSGTTISDQMDLLNEQVKMLAGEVALCTSSLKRLSEQAAHHPDDMQILDQMQKLKNEINEKKLQMHVLEQRMIGSFEVAQPASRNSEVYESLSKLTTQLSEKTFELEIMSADNRVLQEQLQMKISENGELQQTISQLRQQIDSLPEKSSRSEGYLDKNYHSESTKKCGLSDGPIRSDETSGGKNKLSDVNCFFSSDLHEVSMGISNESSLKAQVLLQAAEIENLKQEKVRLVEEKDGLEIHSQKLAEETSYAKELAAAAAVELRNLAEEVTKLSYQNAKLTGDLAVAKEMSLGRSNCQRYNQCDGKQGHYNIRPDSSSKKKENGALVEELHRELATRRQREASLIAALSEKDHREAELQRRINDAKQHERELENELANMWVLVGKIKKNGVSSGETVPENLNEYDFRSKQSGLHLSNGNCCTKFMGDQLHGSVSTDGISSFDDPDVAYEHEKKCKELESIISRLKGEDLTGLDNRVLEDLQSFHVEALSKICQEKLSKRVQ